MSESLPVTVVIPTIGRAGLLDRCLHSLSVCVPGPAEIIVVDQSTSGDVSDVTARYRSVGARRLRDAGRGPARARNIGVREARHDVVLMTDDDCSVAPSWIGAAWQHMAGHPIRVITGRVLPAGDPATVPSTIDETTPRDYTGGRHCGVLYADNMAVNRSAWVAFGGFDERLRTGEDCDACYRWLKAGHELLFRPEPVVWHHAWRTNEELRKLAGSYWRGQGAFYGKHLWTGDVFLLRVLAGDIYRGLRAKARAVRGGGPAWDEYRGVLPWVLIGLARGLWMEAAGR